MLFCIEISVDAYALNLQDLLKPLNKNVMKQKKKSSTAWEHLGHGSKPSGKIQIKFTFLEMLLKAF